MLKEGELLTSESGVQVTVGKVLGTGTQGAVHEGRTGDGHAVAIKWYQPAFQQQDLRDSITLLVQQKAPSTHFLWPTDIVTKGSHFGYVMPLRPPNYAGLTKVLNRKVSIRPRELVRAGRHMVAAFKALQAKGLFYCDISDNNLFVNPDTGDILICDNDNVGSSRGSTRVLGTPRFMAPEIVRGEKRPSALTDSFSMAVLLFLLLMNDHPLQGQAEAKIHAFDAAAMRKIYGTDPIFIFDPVNKNNRPVPGIHDNAPIFWGLYPPAIREIFTRVFTEGIHEPGGRPSFGEWEAALAATEDVVVNCYQCNRENFYQTCDATHTCWGCQARLQIPMKLVIDGRRVVILNDDTKLYSHHLTKRGTVTMSDPPQAEVAKHPTRGFLGLKNLSATQWYMSSASGAAARVIEPGQSIKLAPGTHLDFGTISATVEA
ncbi:MAG TPA: protein kinase [Pseudonocardiaceae bacterium]|nr:protein kinase [Pseudonocardiaceae bacterium]